jgi:hypothetical protein
MSLSDKLIPDSSGMKKEAGRGGGGGKHSSNYILSVSKILL